MTTHASLFSGFGASDLAAHWMGWKNLFWCEIDPFPRQVLEYWFPNSIKYEDITKTDFTPWRGRIDVLTGGFPCQPFSHAGKRKGADDDRYLWPHMLRAIREIRPTWVVGENVAGIISMVQPGSETTVESQATLFEKADKETIHEQEFVIETICRDIEQAGYSVQPLVIPACAIGAPHRRDRIFFIAHRSDARIESVQRKGEDGIHAAEPAAYAKGDGGDRAPHEASSPTWRQNWNETEQPEQRGEVRSVTNPTCQQSERMQPKQPEHSQPQQGQPRGECGEDGSRATSHPECERSRQVQYKVQPEQSDGEGFDCASCKRDVANSNLQRCPKLNATSEPTEQGFAMRPPIAPRRGWDNFPTQSPVRFRYDGISNNVGRYIKNEVYEELKKHFRGEDLQNLWMQFSKKEIREQIGRLYEIPEPNLLLEILQRTKEADGFVQRQECLSPFSERTSKKVLLYMRGCKTFASSPLGQRYKKQQIGELTDSMCELSYEIALAAKKIVEECESTSKWVATNSIKGYGNAIVPQVIYEIFKAMKI